MIDSTNPRIMANNIRELAANSGGGGTTVVANPEGEATAALAKLQVGEGIYSIPQPTTVEANPVGEATTGLTKLEVGSTIYSIPQAYTPISYSTTEQDTGLKWIDNSTIYSKTYEIENAATLTSQQWSPISDINLPDVASIIDHFIVGTDGTNLKMLGCGVQADNKNLIMMNTRNTNITVGVGAIVCLQYVKTPPTTNTRKKKS